MNAPFIVCLVLCIGFGAHALYARNLERADEYHLLHGPKSNCPTCEEK